MRSIWTAACAAIVSVATVGAFAQAPQQTTTQQTPPAPAQASPPSSDQPITVTGCLKAAPDAAEPPAAAATAGTAGTAATATTGTAGTMPDRKFILTSASAAPGNTASAATYRLIANPTALGEHVGKKLELVGTLDPTSKADEKDPLASAPALRVQSGKIVAASCNN
jgi:hypothetical protein